MKDSMRQFVRERAENRCEYCRLPDHADEWPFHVDHIIALVHGGGSEDDNICWSCTQCNLHKASNFASIDPESGDRVDLFNPRKDTWHDHLLIDADGYVLGLTPSGRATVRLLDMNGSPQLELRRDLIQRGQFFD